MDYKILYNSWKQKFSSKMEGKWGWTCQWAHNITVFTMLIKDYYFIFDWLIIMIGSGDDVYSLSHHLYC